MTIPRQKHEVKAVKEKVEPATRELEYIFIPDFVKVVSLSELLETRLSPIAEVAREVAPILESFHLSEVRKAEQPLIITSGQCEETARRDGAAVEPYIKLTAITEMNLSEAEATKKKTRGRNKTDLGIPLDSLHPIYRNTEK